MVLFHRFVSHTGSTAEGKDKESWEEQEDTWIFEKVTQMLKVLPACYDIDKVRKTFQINITPTGVVLMQELEHFNQLVTAIEHDLIDLRNVSTVNRAERT